VTLTNVGATTLSLTARITIEGADPGDFAETNNCGASVDAGLSCTIRVIFEPTASGDASCVSRTMAAPARRLFRLAARGVNLWPRQADEGVGRGPGGPPHNLPAAVIHNLPGAGLQHGRLIVGLLEQPR
jgi:hypothetical protein